MIYLLILPVIYFIKIKIKKMNTKQRWLYIAFFWKYVSAEQLEDMLELSIESMADYILTMWEEFYNQFYNDSNNSTWLLEHLKLYSKVENL